jgi:hypothetical protein
MRRVRVGRLSRPACRGRRALAVDEHDPRPRQGEVERRRDDVGQAGTGEQRGRAAVVEQDRELVFLHRRVQRHDRRPGLERREQGDHELGRVLEQQCDPVARRDARLDEVGSGGVARRRDLAEGPRAVADEQRRPLRPPLRGARQELVRQHAASSEST